MNVVLDTNIALYFMGDKLAEPLPNGIYYVSVITEMELLSYHALQSTEEQKIKAFLKHINIIGLTPEIKTKAIYLRQTYKLKLPDAIIAATAILLKAKFITNDSQLHHISELETQSMTVNF